MDKIMSKLPAFLQKLHEELSKIGEDVKLFSDNRLGPNGLEVNITAEVDGKIDTYSLFEYNGEVQMIRTIYHPSQI